MARVCRDRGFRVAVQSYGAIGARPVFDWVLCIGSLEFAPDPRRALREMVQILAPGGRVGLLYPRRTWLGQAYRLYHRSHRVRIHLWTPAQMDRLLEEVGLSRGAPWWHGRLSSLSWAEPGRC